MDGRQALQQLVGRQQRRDKRVLDDGTGRLQHESQALGAQRLEAVGVVAALLAAAAAAAIVISAVAVTGAPGRGRGQCQRGRRPGGAAGAGGVQEGLQPVGGTPAEVAEQRCGVAAQGAQSATANHRLQPLAGHAWRGGGTPEEG